MAKNSTILIIDDEKDIRESLSEILLDEGYETCGVAAEIGMALQEDIFYDLDCPIERITTASVPIPFSPVLEHEIMPNENKILHRALKMVKG